MWRNLKPQRTERKRALILYVEMFRFGGLTAISTQFAAMPLTLILFGSLWTIG